MSQTTHCAVAAAAMLVSAGAAHGEMFESGNTMLPACQDYISRTSLEMLSKQGQCFGIAQALVFASRFICAPEGSRVGQDVRIIIRFLEEHPERLHESFLRLADEALKTAWPCR